MNAYIRTSQCPEPSHRSSKAMSSLGSSSQGQKRSSKSSNTSYTSKSSAYDRDFEQKCVDNGIYMPGRIRRPDNWEDLQNALASSRRSLSPSKFSDGAFDRFCEAEAEARDEDDVTTDSPYHSGRETARPSLSQKSTIREHGRHGPRCIQKGRARPLLGSTTRADRPTSQARLKPPDRPVDERHLSSRTEFLSRSAL